MRIAIGDYVFAIKVVNYYLITTTGDNVISIRTILLFRKNVKTMGFRDVVFAILLYYQEFVHKLVTITRH